MLLVTVCAAVGSVAGELNSSKALKRSRLASRNAGGHRIRVTVCPSPANVWLALLPT